VEDVALPARFGPHGISTTSAVQHIGPATVAVDARGYRITAADPRLRVDIHLRPDRGFALPPTELRQGSAISGYVVPALRGRATGTIRTPTGTFAFSDVPAYHDHNWGTWRGVTWEWGEASSSSGAYLYGNVHLPRGDASEGPQYGTLFVWGANSGPALQPASAISTGAVPEERGGLIAALPISTIRYSGWHSGPVVGGRLVPAPAEITVRADNGPDAVVLTIKVWDALGSRPLGADTNPASRAAAGAGGGSTSRPAQTFLQLRGDARLHGMLGGRPVDWQGPAASETFVGP
jgi:hypothetical protein